MYEPICINLSTNQCIWLCYNIDKNEVNEAARVGGLQAEHSKTSFFISGGLYCAQSATVLLICSLIGTPFSAPLTASVHHCNVLACISHV